MRRLLRISLVCVALLIAAFLAFQLPAVKSAVGRRALVMVNERIPGEIEVGSFGGNLLSRLVLRDVVVRYRGEPFMRAGEVTVEWNPFALLGKEVDIHAAEIKHARLEFFEHAGRMNVASAFQAPDTGPPRPPSADALRIRIGKLAAQDVVIVMAARSITVETVTGSFAGIGDTYEAQVASLRAAISTPDVYVSAASGTVSITSVSPYPLFFSNVRGKLRESPVTLEGVYAPGEGGSFALDVAAAPLAPADGRPLGSPVAIPVALTARLDGPRADLKFQLTAQSRAGNVRAGGWAALPVSTAADTTVRYDAAVTLAAVEPLVWLGKPAAKPTRLTGVLRARGRAGDRARMDARFEGKSSLVGGVAVRSFDARAEQRGRRIEARLRLASARGRATAKGFVDLKRRSFAASVTVNGLRPDDWLGPKYPGAVTLTASVTGRGFEAATLRGRGRVQVRPSRVAGLHIARADIPFAVADGRLRVLNAVVDSDALDARVSGDVALTAARRGTLRALVRSDDWGDLLPGVPDADAEGRAMLRLKAAGSPQDLHVTLTGHAAALKFRELSLPDADLAVEVQNLDFARKRGRGEALVTAVAPVYGARGLRKLTVRMAYAKSVTADAGSVALDAVGEGAVHALRGKFELDLPGFLVTLERLSVSVAGQTWQNAGVARIDTRGPGLRIDAFDLRSGEQRIFADGRIDPGGKQNLRVLVNRVRLAPFRTLLNQTDNFDGRLDGSLWATGTPQAPKIDATFVVADLKSAEYRVEMLSVVADFRGDSLGVQVRLVQKGGAGMLRADAVIPLDFSGGSFIPADRPLTGNIQTHGVSLRILYALGVPVEDAAGEVFLDVRLRGTARAPRFGGAIRIANGKLSVPKTGVSYRNIALDARLRGTYVELVRLRVETAGGGELTSRGRVGIPIGRSGQLSLRIIARRFLAADNELAAGRIEADLSVSGTTGEPVVTGEIATAGLTIMPPNQPDKQLEPLVFDYPGIHVAGAPQDLPQGAPQPREIAVPILARAALDLRLTARRNTWVRNDAVNVELRGGVRAFKDAGEPKVRLSGEITTVRGTYRLQGKRLNIQEGALNFTGTSEINPLLDVTLGYEVPDYEIAAHVTGTTRKPVLNLTSRPPLEEADILAVLLFGRPFDQLGGGEQVEMRQRVGQLLGGFAAAELRKQLGTKLGFDTLDIKPGSSEEESAAVGVGKYVSNDIFVQYVQRFGADAASEVRLEYYFRSNWLVQTAAATNGESGADIFWHVKF